MLTACTGSCKATYNQKEGSLLHRRIRQKNGKLVEPTQTFEPEPVSESSMDGTKNVIDRQLSSHDATVLATALTISVLVMRTWDVLVLHVQCEKVGYLLVRTCTMPRADCIPWHTHSLLFKNERVTTLSGRQRPLGLLHPAEWRCQTTDQPALAVRTGHCQC
jgi:hypothetical protein